MPSVDRHMSRDLLTVEAGLPVVAVARRMVDRNVGAVLVLEDGRVREHGPASSIRKDELQSRHAPDVGR